MTIGQTLRSHRKAKGMTLQDVADRAGWHKTTVLRYETGALSPRYDDLQRLARILGCRVRDLVPGA